MTVATGDWEFRRRFGMFVHWGIYAVGNYHEQHQQRLGRIRDRQIVAFDEWHRLESSRGSWWTSLPKCPKKLCMVDDKPTNPDSSKWQNPQKPSRPERLLHPGTYWSMRSKKFGGHSNQCTYNKDGELLTKPAGAGTVDWRPPSLAHYNHDVEPAILAANLDGNNKTLFSGSISIVGSNMTKYYQVRPLWAEN